MLTINNLQISYGKNKVIKKLSLALPLGQVHGLVGLNGSGKSTLLKGIYGLNVIESGTISLNDAPLSPSAIAFFETENFFYSNITGYEYLKLFQQRNPAFDINQWNSLFELPLSSLIETYSTGMKKKLAFMGIVCLNKPILILDEPFNGIDMETTQKLKLIIEVLIEKGRTIILTSHVFESLVNICDTISYLKNGSIEFTVEKGDFLNIEKRIFEEFNLENEIKVKNLLRDPVGNESDMKE